MSYEGPLTECYVDPLFSKPLNIYNVLEYFSGSQFYDKDCKNEEIAVRFNLTTIPFPSSDVGYYSLKKNEVIYDELRSYFTEFEDDKVQYDVVQCPGSDSAFVIYQYNCKQRNELITEALYYIENSVIYRVPDLASVAASRLMSITTFLQKGLDNLAQNKKYSPRSGYTWISASTHAATQPAQIINKSSFLSADTQVFLKQVDDSIGLLAERVREKLQKKDNGI
ncbi:uncharacterized protein LOC135119908 [Zophobas morio]|uniref:uncharacterized protein LOC135119908 n=1 Tax=Zophobas morio TaxID=2755281 RepID=UPI003083B677